jgi:hypothetical protein
MPHSARIWSWGGTCTRPAKRELWPIGVGLLRPRSPGAAVLDPRLPGAGSDRCGAGQAALERLRSGSWSALAAASAGNATTSASSHCGRRARHRPRNHSNSERPGLALVRPKRSYSEEDRQHIAPS